MGMKVLVTGGAGFIGRHVVDRFISEGADVSILDNFDPQVHGEFPSHSYRVPVYFGSVTDGTRVRVVLETVRPEVVVHLAAAVGVGQSMYKPSYYVDVNVRGQAVLQEAIAEVGGVKRFVVASSMSVYGEGGHERVCEDRPPNPTSIYAITKLAQEQMALCFGAAYDIPTVALRFFNVYGPGQSLSNPYTGVVAIFISRLLNGKPPLVFEDGEQTRDFVHVQDVARAVFYASQNGHGVYNVCTGRPTTILKVARMLSDMINPAVRPVVLGKSRAGDIRHCIGSWMKAYNGLGFTVNILEADGLVELVKWAKTQASEDRVESSIQELEVRGLVRT